MTPSISELLVVLVMCAILVYYASGKKRDEHLVLVTSQVDGRAYMVQPMNDQQDAADLLASINLRLVELVQHMMARYGLNDPDVERMFKRYDPSTVSEGPVENGTTSYSVNKGENIVLCIRQKSGEFVPINTLMYVAIHEIAHIMTPTVGHTPSFWTNFRFLLTEAMSIGLYTRTDFDGRPEDYCGIQITSSVV
jgi:hypothetical protein